MRRSSYANASLASEHQRVPIIELRHNFPDSIASIHNVLSSNQVHTHDLLSLVPSSHKAPQVARHARHCKAQPLQSLKVWLHQMVQLLMHSRTNWPSSWLAPG